MENHKTFSRSLLFLATILFFSSPPVSSRNLAATGGNGDKASDAKLKTYIIHVLPQDDISFVNSNERVAWYHSFLPDSVLGSVGESRMVFTYTEVFSGFTAKLTEDELKAMEAKPGFGRAYPDDPIPLLTTHSSSFMGLNLGSGLWTDTNLGRRVIIGVLDTGVVPTHPSFNDEGMSPPPSKWKGRCDFQPGCNNKLIGAVSFAKESNGDATSLDIDGHGTHTASTAAGNFVSGVNIYGLANGSASGVAPRAHVAVYKVCNEQACEASAILAGLDAAVKDGVDVLSLSLGGGATVFYNDPLAIGAFGAIANGVFVSCAASNAGPLPKTVTNTAPWILTVAASTTDRRFLVRVTLGNGDVFDGQTLYQPQNFTSTELPLYYPAGANSSCFNLDLGVDVQGKVLFCGDDANGSPDAVVKNAGGAAMIITNPYYAGYTSNGYYYSLPTANLPFDAGSKIAAYIQSTNNPTVTLNFYGTVTGVQPAPTMAFFSSRGPSTISPNILKPDIAGPGVDILAAWPSFVASDGNNSTFNMITGTSMATPHLSGLAALVKSAHPDWSPAAIKSAIMTTSYIQDNQGKPIKDEHYNVASVYHLGAGHATADKVTDPGLVYDISTEDYIPYLCGLYNNSGLSAIVGHAIQCSVVGKISESQLNYPAIAVNVSPITVQRTVTNVGDANSMYEVEVDQPEGVAVSVNPQKLQFTNVGEKISFSVTLSSNRGARSMVSGNLKWVSDKHVVRIPIVVSL